MIIVKKTKYMMLVLLVIVFVGCSKEEAKVDDTKKEKVISEVTGIQELSSGKGVLTAGRDWNESERFKLTNIDLIGKPEVLGVTFFDETAKFYRNKPQKHIWFFWGRDVQNKKELSVIGFHKDSNEQVEIVNNAPLSGPLNGAINHAPVMMKFTKSGIWVLDVYMDQQLFGSVTIHVEDGA